MNRPTGLLQQAIYASIATDPFAPEDLRPLVERSRRRNATLRVTGMMLYCNGVFLQVLEGPEDAVDELYRSIARDPRHGDLRVLLCRHIRTREFGDWHMGFTDTSHAPTSPRGHVDYYRELPALTDAAMEAVRYLRFFQSGIYRQSNQSALSM